MGRGAQENSIQFNSVLLCQEGGRHSRPWTKGTHAWGGAEMTMPRWEAGAPV